MRRGTCYIPPRMLSFSFTVPSPSADRADRLVMAFAPRPVARSAVSACFAAGGVVASGRALSKSDRPPPGAVVSVSGLEEPSDRAARPEPDLPLSVAWENADLLALDKPSGQPCHPLSPGETGTLAGALLARYPETASVGPDPLQPGIVHRIDAGTSGLVIAARNQAAYDAVRAQFAAKTVRKVYLALVHGRVASSGGVSGHLAHSTSFRGRMRVVSPGALPGGERPMFAETFWKPLAPGPGGTTLLEVVIRTGVTHQIRCHLASAGHPIVGDAVYAPPSLSAAAPPLLPGAAPAPDPGAPPARRPPLFALHSLSASLLLPGSGRPATLRVPPPPWARSV